MDFRELGSRHGLESRRITQTVEGLACVNRHQADVDVVLLEMKGNGEIFGALEMPFYATWHKRRKLKIGTKKLAKSLVLAETKQQKAR